MSVTSVPQSACPARESRPQEEVVLGVDTHRDFHMAAVVTPIGGLVATGSFQATAAGYRRMLTWARALGVVERAAVEGTGSYGAALSRYLQAEGIEVIDVNQPDRAARRKTDAVDAESAARAVISGRSASIAKTGDGLVEAMRLLKLARDSAVNAGTKAINQLRAILVGADPALRESLAGLGPASLIRACAVLDDPGQDASEVQRTVIYTLRLLATRILALKAESSELHKRLTGLIDRHAPQLLERPGVGPDSAAALLIAAGDNPGRLRREGSYAALCGVSPVEASSGNTRRRLNCGGDRQANAALYRIAISRLRWDQRTQDYLQRRLADGKTRREAIRCLIAREIYALLRGPAHPPGT